MAGRWITNSTAKKVQSQVLVIPEAAFHHWPSVEGAFYHHRLIWLTAFLWYLLNTISNLKCSFQFYVVQKLLYSPQITVLFYDFFKSSWKNLKLYGPFSWIRFNRIKGIEPLTLRWDSLNTNFLKSSTNFYYNTTKIL